MATLTLNYPAKRLKDARRAADRDLAMIKWQGYRLVLASWAPNRRGCLATLFGTWLLPPGGVLTVVFDDGRRSDV